MRPLRVPSSLFVLMLAAPSIATQAELVDAVVATVGKEVILYSEIVSSIGSELEKIRSTSTSQSEYDRRADKLIDDTLEEAIESKILLREARKFSIEVSDDEIETQIDALRSTFNSDEEFMAAVQAAGESLSDLRERKRKQQMARIVSVIKLNSFLDEIIVSEEDILQYYQDHRKEFERPERIRVRQIFLPAGRDAEERASVQARLQALRDEIDAGADFEELAKLHSQALGAEEGGIVGWQKRGDLVPVLDAAAFALQAGATSEVVEARYGFHLLHVDEREEKHFAPLDEVRMTIEPQIRAEAADARYQKWLGDLRKRSRVRIFR